MGTTIATVAEGDLGDLLPLMRGYCDFYEVAVTDEELLAISRALIADPEHEGVQLIARDETTGTALGFATVYWTWTTTRGGRLGVMNDLFVAPEARGSGAADALILAARDRAREHGAIELEWATALDNHRAQKVYDRVGGQRSQWLTYSLDT
jgi:GNAT superfamily N-acetyltransferase